MAQPTIVRPPWLTHPPEVVPPTAAQFPAGNRRGLPASAPPDPVDTHFGPIDQHVRALLQYMAAHDVTREHIAQELWAEIPQWVQEANADLSGSKSVLQVQPQFKQTVLITSVLVSIPASAGGIVQLGNIAIPVNGGVTQWGGVQFILAANDTRQLTSNVAGQMAMVLHGKQMPRWGRIT